MKRRGFLGLLGLSPFGAKMAADDALVQMGFQHGSKVLSAAAPAVGRFDWPSNSPGENAPTSSSDMGWLADRGKNHPDHNCRNHGQTGSRRAKHG